jgi:hypothetical protein
LGITVTKSISSLHQHTVHDVKKEIQIGFSKIAADRGKYHRRELGRLHSTFCNNTVLYLSGLPVLKKKDVKHVQSFYFRYCKFYFISPPPWHSSGKIICKFEVLHVTAKFALLQGRLSDSSFCRFSPHHPLVRLFG